jgi:general secretion pathway protein A
LAGYLDHFALAAAPFSTTPDPAFAYATREHQLAVAKIQYSVEERQGIFLLLGEIGCGKTTVSQFMLNEWRDDPAMAVVYITNPSVRTPSQFLRLILAHFQVDHFHRLQDNWDALRALLVANYRSRRNTTIVLDEAQTISPENMETLTHISNEQTQKVKLAQVVLLAQPNFLRKLAYKPALRDRIAHGSTLNPLSYEDSIDLLNHRLRVAGGVFESLFPGELPRMVYNTTKGIPRRLCMLCDSMLLNAYALGKVATDEQAFTDALQDLTFKGWQDNKP